MPKTSEPEVRKPPIIQNIGRVALGLVLLLAGTGHLSFARHAFLAQVPTWLPLAPDFVVVASGVVEILLGVALLTIGRYRLQVGLVVALFFIAVFPGNVSQLATHTDSFGLDTDTSRFVRLLFQPLLVIWALWSTGVFSEWRRRRNERRDQVARTTS